MGYLLSDRAVTVLATIAAATKIGVCVCVCVCWSLSPVQLFATPWTVARQAPLSMGFSG